MLIDIAAAAAAGGTYRLGLYNSDATGLFPNHLLSEFANGSTAAIAVIPNVIGSPIGLTANTTYWLAVVMQNNVTGLTVRSRGDNSSLIVQTQAAPILSTPMTAQYHNAVTAALPDPFGSIDGQTQGPEFALWFI